ncbi:MAG: DUF997 family protein [Planctomycetaceae bacterium]
MSQTSEDPVLRSARREAIIVFTVFIIACAYTISYCYLHGYGRELEDLEFVLGFPDWVFWGIIAPWSVCIVFAFLFGTVFIKDETLGEDPDESEADFEQGS